MFSGLRVDRRDTPLTVAVTNTVVLNGGDAAILEALVALLRGAFGSDTRVLVYDEHLDAARRRYPGYEFRRPLERGTRVRGGPTLLRPALRGLRRARLYAAAWLHGRGLGRVADRILPSGPASALAELAGADLVVSTGGTYLVERYPLAERFVDLRAALLARRPLVLFTQSLGPFRRARNRIALGPIVRRARLVLVRDERSRRHLLDLGADPRRVELSADAAFALPGPHPVAPRSGDARSPRIAVSVRHWLHFQSPDGRRRYEQAVAELVHALVARRGAEVTFVSTCQGASRYAKDDSVTAEAIAERLPAETRRSVTVDGAFHRPGELIEVLGGFDLVVATRMHAAILALVAGTPVYPIAYEFKTEELSERLGLADRVERIEELTGGSLTAGVERLLDELPTIAGPLWERVDRERVLAGASGERVRAALEGASER